MRRQVRRTTQQQQEALHTSPPAPALSSCDITNEAASAGARLSMRMLPPRSVSPSRAASFASSIGRRSPSSSTSTSAGVVGKCLPTISSRASLRETTAARGASSANSSRRVAGGMAGSGAAKKSTRSDKKPMVNITATDAVVNEAVHQQQHLSSASSGGEAVTITKLTCGAKRSRSSDITTLDTSSSLTTTTLRTDGTPTARRIGGGGEKREKENSTADDDDDDVGTHVMNSVLITNQPTIPKPLDKKHDTLMDGRESPGPSLVVRGGREGREREVCAPTVSTSQICNKGVNGDSDDVNEHDNSPRRRGGQHEVVLDGGTDSSPAFRDHRSFESCASASTYQHSASLFQQQQPQQEEAKEDAYYPTNTENAPDCSIAVPVVLKNDIKSGGGGGEDMSCSPSSRGGRPTATPLRRDAEAGGVVEGRASVKDRDETKKKEGEGEAAMMDIVMSTTTPQSTDDNFFSLLSFAQRKQLASLLLSQGEKLFITNSSHSTTATKSPPNDDDDDDHNKKNNSISNNTNNTYGEINIIDNRNNIRQSQRYQEEDADKKADEKVHRLLLAGAGNKRVREEGESGDALPLVVQMIEETLCLLKPMLLGDTAHGSYRRAGEDTNSNTNNANCVNRLPASEREALLLLCSSSSSSSSSSSWSPSSASSAPLQASILNASFMVPQLLKEIDSLQSQLKKKAEEMESVVKENEHYKSFFRIIESRNGLSGKGVEEVTDGTRRSERRQQDTKNTSKTPPPSGRPVSIRLEDSGLSQRSSLLGYVPCSSLPASATSTTTSLAPPNPRFSLLTNRGVAGVEAVSSSDGSSSTLLSNATATACHSPIKFKSLEAARAARRAVSFLLPSLTSTRTNGTMPKRDGDGVNCLTNVKEEENVVEDEEGQGKENYQGRLMSTSVAAAGNTGASFQSESLHIDKHAQGSSFDAAEGVQQRVSAGDWVGSDLSVSFAFQASEGVNATSPVPSSKRYRSEGAAVSSAHMTPLEKARAANFQLRRSMNL